MQRNTSRRRATRIAAFIGAALLIAVIMWVDIATPIWQEFVIVAGLAAGLVTFLLTVLVLDRVLARSAARRWAPVNRLAISEFLHEIADDEHSEVSRGHIVARSLKKLDPDVVDEPLIDRLHELRALLVAERRLLTDTLSRWANFLAESGDNETILLHIAQIALKLDHVRDAALELEAVPEDAARRAQLNAEIDACNAAIRDLSSELSSRLAELSAQEQAGE